MEYPVISHDPIGEAGGALWDVEIRWMNHEFEDKKVATSSLPMVAIPCGVWTSLSWSIASTPCMNS